MPNPSPTPAVHRWPRWCARFAILAPMASVLVMMVAQQLTRGQSEAGVLYHGLSAVALALILGGVISGVAGLAGGWRSGSRDTIIIALVGLLLSGGLAIISLKAILWWLRL